MLAFSFGLLRMHPKFAVSIILVGVVVLTLTWGVVNGVPISSMNWQVSVPVGVLKNLIFYGFGYGLAALCVFIYNRFRKPSI